MDTLQETLENARYDFLNRTERRISSFISSKGSHCIDLVARSNGKVVATWSTSPDKYYCKALYHFMRKKQYNGYNLESALGEPVTDIVVEEWVSLYEDNNDIVAQAVLERMITDGETIARFVDKLCSKVLKDATADTRRLASKLITQQVKDMMHHGALQGVTQQITTQIGHFAAQAAASQVATVVAHLLVKILIMNMGHIVAQILASSAVHHAIAMAVKKVVLGVVLASVLHFVATQLGVAIGSSAVMWIILPIIAGFILYKMVTFPDELGEKVAAKVRGELDSQYDAINEEILTSVVDNVVEGDDLIEKLSNDSELRRNLQALGGEM